MLFIAISDAITMHDSAGVVAKAEVTLSMVKGKARMNGFLVVMVTITVFIGVGPIRRITQVTIFYDLIIGGVDAFRSAATSNASVEHVMERYAIIEDKERLCIFGYG